MSHVLKLFSEAVEDAELLNIYTYLYEYAADSPTPAKCK